MSEQYRDAGDEKLPRVLAGLPTAAGTIAIAAGGLALCGWLFDLRPLRQPLTAYVAMNPATAAGLILVGVALLWSLENRDSGKARWIAKSCSGVVVFLGLIKLVGVALGWHPNVDEFLFGSMLNGAGGPPNRMAPNTALNLVLLGGALLLLDLRWRGTSAAQLLSAAAGFAALLPLTGYLYGVSSFEGVASFIPMAHTRRSCFFSWRRGCFSPDPTLIGHRTSQHAIHAACWHGVSARRWLFLSWSWAGCG